MDIESRLSLRTFVKPATAPIVKAIIGACIVHLAIGFYLNYRHPQVVAKLPGWMNIKLIAGFEENKINNSRKKNTAEKTYEGSHENKYTGRSKQQDNQKLEQNSEQKEKYKENKSLTTPATTTVKASSQLYKFENPKPVYPAAARRRGMQGVVLLNVEVNANGQVTRVEILQSSGFRILDVAAIQSVEQWHFLPGSEGGVNSASIVKIPIRFSLHETNN